MPTTLTRNFRQLGYSPDIEAHDLDLIHDLGRRVGCLGEYDRFIANADGRPELQDFWRDLKSQEQGNIDQLKDLIKRLVQDDGS